MTATTHDAKPRAATTYDAKSAGGAASDAPPGAELRADYIRQHRRLFREAVARVNRKPEWVWRDFGPDSPLAGLPGVLFAFGWLRERVDPGLRAEIAGLSDNPANAYLIPLLLERPDEAAFVAGFLDHWNVGRPMDRPGLMRRILDRWGQITPFSEPLLERFRHIQAQQKEEFVGPDHPTVRRRLALIDALPDPGPDAEETRFDKTGVALTLACPESCRHCMFVWRPRPRPPLAGAPIAARIAHLADNQLFTGGDLTHHLAPFLEAIAQPDGPRTIAILLNGALAGSLSEAQALFDAIRQALAQRPPAAPERHVLIQISFDEYHQEIRVDRQGALAERIPVACIANLLQAALDYPEIEVALLHKQNRLNFSTALFTQGVFARLGREMARRGLPIKVRSHTPSPRPKADPVAPNVKGAVIREALFTLMGRPRRPFRLFSSAIDAYGRAQHLDPSEFINERDFLDEVLAHGPPPGERFDIDPMFHPDGTVTLFSALHICLGGVGESPLEALLARWRKDPLIHALARFDRRLLGFYAELRPDLPALLAAATGPHHLFHRLTRDPEVRLGLTERLLTAPAPIPS